MDDKFNCQNSTLCLWIIALSVDSFNCFIHILNISFKNLASQRIKSDFILVLNVLN